jgi:hypothetical protein
MLKEIFAGERGEGQETYGYFSETPQYFYPWTGLTPAAEKVLRRLTAKAYKVPPEDIVITAVREFSQYFSGDQSFGEVEITYNQAGYGAIWGICGNEDRTNAHFVCFAD